MEFIFSEKLQQTCLTCGKNGESWSMFKDSQIRCMPVISVLRKHRQKDSYEFGAILSYKVPGQPGLQSENLSEQQQKRNRREGEEAEGKEEEGREEERRGRQGRGGESRGGSRSAKDSKFEIETHKMGNSYYEWVGQLIFEKSRLFLVVLRTQSNEHFTTEIYLQLPKETFKRVLGSPESGVFAWIFHALTYYLSDYLHSGPAVCYNR